MKPNLTESDIAFAQGIKILSDVKLVLGGQAVYSTLRKHKAFKTFMESYIRQHHSLTLDSLEESIANL